MSRSPLFLIFLVACEGPPGDDGLDGSDGTNGIDGIDGEDGSDGEDGTDGENGIDGEDLSAAPESLDVVITDFDMGSPQMVTFEVVDQDGVPFNRLDQDWVTGRGLRVAVVQLVPGVDGAPDTWQSYINTEEDTSTSTAGPDGVPVLATAIQATTENSGTFEYLGDGVYTYTFAADLTDISDPLEVVYDEDLLHRVAFQFSYDGILLNPWMDWVPSGADAPATRDIVAIESCNECHGELALHGGGRLDTKYCVTCHNPGSTDANSGNTVDFPVMIHSIHAGHDLPVGPYIIWGYRDGEHDYSHVGYPQDVNNCAKCHDGGDEDTPDGDNWFNRPTADACEGCHNDLEVRESTTDHTGGQQADDSNCSTCHSADGIQSNHVSENATPNNPGLPDGVWDITYAIQNATMSGTTLTVEVIIEADGTALDLTDLPDDLTGPGRYPSLLLAWAMSQDGFTTPSDYNNYPNSTAQPTRVGLDDFISGEDGTVTYSNGVNTLVLEDAYPEGAGLRAAGVEGYFRQDVDGEEVARHAVSVITPVDGDEERRVIVDSEKCSSCHEWFEGHGGNRVYEAGICVTCHNANLSSSGTVIDPDYPESAMNLRDLVHGIHGTSVRTEPLDFVRNRNGGTRYTFISHDMLEDNPDGHVVTFPNDPGNCLVCHDGDSYSPEAVPVDALASTYVTTDGSTDFSTARVNVPNDMDLVTSPTAAGCGSCHDSAMAGAHMEQNGGAMLWPRYQWVEEAPYETCTLCHGSGRTADVSEMHSIQ